MTWTAFRWATATAVTIAAFAAATWICGALVLTLHDNAVQWGIAGGLGAAALWGHSYATAEPHQAQPRPEPQPDGVSSTRPDSAASDGGGATRNTISDGLFHGFVIQGRDFGTDDLIRLLPPHRSGRLPRRRARTGVTPVDNDGIGSTITGGIFFNAVVRGGDITVVLPPKITPGGDHEAMSRCEV